MSSPGHRKQNGHSGRWLLLAVVLLGSLTNPGNLLAQDPGNEPGLDLTSPVRQQLRFLAQAWQSWTRAYYQSEEDAASNAIDQLTSTATKLGMGKLPDLSSAAAGLAIRSAREGNLERARWTLSAARALDPERPEADFAAATIHRLEGDYLGAISSAAKGYVSLLRLPLERSIWLHNAGLWLLYVLLASAGFFVALQMATKGGALFHDLARFMSPPLPLTTADLLTLLALLWPLVLPHGLLWLALYWSILLWGYGSLSEKLVFVLLWLTLGISPLVLSYQQREIQLALAPPNRACDNLAAGRLYGAMFSDLGVLRTLLPSHPVANEVLADLHRRFGQWEHARSIYTTLLETGELQGRNSAAARNNIGVYHHRRKDYGTAVNYFRQAAQDNPELPEVHFNLAQAYSQLYKFSDSNLSMAQAKDLDRTRVNVWERADVPIEQSAVGVDGGIRRAEVLRQALESTWFEAESSTTAIDLWRRHLSLSVMAGVLLLAVTLHLVRSQIGYRSTLLERRPVLAPASDRWLRALVPGLASARDENGVKALAAIVLPMGLAMLLVVRSLGYRAPVAADPGPWLVTGAALGGLAVLYLIRLRLVWEQ